MERLHTIAPATTSAPGSGHSSPALDVPHEAFLASTGETDELPQRWLRTYCHRAGECRRAILLLASSDTSSFDLAAAWPEDADVDAMLSLAETVLTKHEGITQTSAPAASIGPGAARPEAATLFAEPILLEGRLHGAVVLELTAPRTADLERLRQDLLFGSGWLDALLQRRLAEREGLQKGQLETALALVGAPLEKERFQGSVTSFATELASELGCERAAVAFLRKGRARIAGLSHSSKFGKRSNLIAAVEMAMDEALDQQTSLVYPPVGEVVPRATQAHAELSREFGANAICTIPLVRSGEPCGAITLERSEPFDLRAITLLEVVASLVGPVLEDRRREDRLIGAKLLDSMRALIARLIGPRYVASKLVVGAVVLAVALLALANGDFRVSADTTIEAAVMRAAVAPFNGFIASAPVRAGDHVSEGQLLVALDRRDLELERAKWESQLAQVTKQYRAAMAASDAPSTAIQAAAVEEARAELDRVNDRLARTDLRAPFDGVVVSGDLTQRLDSPVRQGEALFEVAPLDAYRVRLDVDEADITYVELGQLGTVVLTSLPSETFDFVVSKITPVSEPKEGRNTFRVEAALSETSWALRPGAEGVAKIEAGRARLAWIWGRGIADWLRLKFWAWTP